MLPIGTDLKRDKFPAATLAIIVANIVMFLFELAMPDASLNWTFETLSFGPGTRNPFSPFVSLFLHADIYHIAFNMLFLWIFGGPVEERVGSRLFLLYYFGAGITAGVVNLVMEVIARPGSTVGAIGASGAISGVMALFLYRCFYSKLKMVVSPILLPRQINIPVIPLVLIWVFQEVIMGIFSLSRPTMVAHWAHVGGFAFGIAVGRIKRYGHEGRVEQLRMKIQKKLEAGGGWKSAEKDLLSLLELAPNDAEVNHDLARLYACNGEPKRAEQHFLAAVKRYFIVQPEYGAYAALEYADTLSKPMDFPFRLKAAEALVRTHDLESAWKILQPLASYGAAGGLLAEKCLLLYIRLCLHLDRGEEAGEAIQLFHGLFPKSKFVHEINAALQKKPGEIFRQASPPVAPSSAGQGATREQKEADRLGAIAFFERVFADPVFWVLLLFLNIAAPILTPGLVSGPLSPVYLFTAAFLMTIVHRMGSLADLWYHLGAPSEKKVLQGVALQRSYDDAVMAERREQYADAASLYERLLAADPRHIQARFNLARLYHNKLNNAADARKHYRQLTEHLPKDHPYRHDAETALK